MEPAGMKRKLPTNPKLIHKYIRPMMSGFIFNLCRLDGFQVRFFFLSCLIYTRYFTGEHLISGAPAVVQLKYVFLSAGQLWSLFTLYVRLFLLRAHLFNSELICRFNCDALTNAVHD